MQKRKIDFSGFAGEARKSTANLLGKAKDSVVKFTDQNGDGEFDLKDVVIVADTLNDVVKNTTDAIKDGLEVKGREVEKRTLKPIFSEDLDDTEFFLSKLIRVTEIDKKHAESEVCQGAIGYMSVQKDLKIVNLFQEKSDMFGLSFYPDIDSEVYYVDPSDRDHYIALNEYFNYLKIVRVSELQKIAQDLGAKHFRVTLKEKKASFTKNTAKIKSSVKAIKDLTSIDIEQDATYTEASTLEIAAESEFPGHAPMEPKLKYLKREPSILSLIELRMDKDAPLSHQILSLNLMNSSGIKANDAAKIDAALKSMKISGNTTVTNEVQNEDRRFFEYEIDF